MNRIAAAICAAVLILSSASAAHADNGTVTRVTLTSNRDFSPNATTLIVSRSVTMAAGESRHLRGRLEATSSTTLIVALTVTVRCNNSSGSAVGVGGATARNHEGSDTTYYAIPGHLPLYADLLFTAPVAGTYTCGVYGWTASSATSSYHLTAVASSTWIEVSNTGQVGSHWWENPACSSDGSSSGCSYVWPGSAPVWVFYNDGTPVYKWTAAGTATSVEALADLTLTTCYTNTGSCQDSTVIPKEKPRGTNATVDLRFEVIQLDTTAHTCRLTTAGTTRRTIRDDAHHYAAYFALSGIPIDSSCGTRQFIIRIYVASISGNPVKIDGRQSTTSLTNGIAMNRF
jgi:hypothetical protein